MGNYVPSVPGSGRRSGHAVREARYSRCMSALPPVTRWDAEQPRGLVHVVHGMAEYGARYARFAHALNAAGLTVWAHDHRGHGQHLEGSDAARASAGHFGEAHGWDTLVDDLMTVSAALQDAAPHLPLWLFAHSMGSFVAQAALMRTTQAYAGVILCGSSGPSGWMEDAMAALARAERRVRGPRTPSRWVQEAVFGAYALPFTPRRTRMDWLSRDAAEVDRYVADPLCGFALTTQAWVDFLGGRAGLGDTARLRAVSPSLPILIVSGARDPVGEFGRGVQRLHEAYRHAGVQDVQLRIYPGARHELLNERNRDEVTADLLTWLQTSARQRSSLTHAS